MNLLKIYIEDCNGKITLEDVNASRLKGILEQFDKNHKKLEFLIINNMTHHNFEIYKSNDKYYIETIKKYKYWFYELDKDSLIYLFKNNKIVEMVYSPEKFNFRKRIGYSIECLSKKEYTKNDISMLITCILELKDNNGPIYIYDFEINMRFSIYKENNLYMLDSIYGYKDFKKDELIIFLSQGFSVFKEIVSHPDALGFITSDN